MPWAENTHAGRYLWPLGEGIEGFLLEQLSNGGSPGLLEIVPYVPCNARGRALALLFGVFPWIIWEKRLKSLIRHLGDGSDLISL